MDNPQVFVLARSKRWTMCWSAFITRRLNALGVDAYRVTPNHVPKYRPERVKLLINYGTSTTPVWWDRLPRDCVILNHPDQVKVSCDKVKMQQAFEEVAPGHHLDYYLDIDNAQEAIDAGETIVARTLVSSHSGRGIVLCPPAPLPSARLYTVLKRRRGLREYRVFMNEGKLVDVVQKKRKSRRKLLEFLSPSEADVWWDSRIRQVVRAWKNGWSFCHNDMDVTDPAVFEEIASATAKLLTWGCVDVLIDTATKEWYLVEINSAPGLDAGNTQGMFVDAFARLANEVT